MIGHRGALSVSLLLALMALPLWPRQAVAESVGQSPWRHAALLRTTDERARAFCSGVLVGPTTVLTAKHCLSGLGGVRGEVGFHFVVEFAVKDGYTTQVARPVRVTPYPGDGRLFPLFDLALIEIDQGLPPDVEPAAMSNVEPSKQAVLTVAGFGSDGKAHEGRVTYLGAINGDRAAGLMVARTPSRGGPCFGDSGGGVYAFAGGRWSLVGLVAGSWDVLGGGLRRCQDSPMVMSDVNRYAPWIKSGGLAQHAFKMGVTVPGSRTYDSQGFLALCNRGDVSSESWMTMQAMIGNVAGFDDGATRDSGPLARARLFLSCAEAHARLTAYTQKGGSVRLTNVRDLTPLLTLPGLTSLVLTDATIADWRVLQRLPRLASVAIIGHRGPLAAKGLLALPAASLSLQYVSIRGSRAECNDLKAKPGVSLRKVDFITST